MNKKKEKFEKIGFKETLEILNDNGGQMKIHAFFNQFIKDSYYNAFYRVKGYMKKNKLITVRDHSIKITKKGIQTLELMNHLKTFIEG